MLPNSDGLFSISVLNVTTKDLNLKAHSKLGTLQPIGSTMEIKYPIMDENTNIESLTLGGELSNGKICELKHFISEFQNTFALNLKKPKRTTLFEHQLVREDALPSIKRHGESPLLGNMT